jgi:uncharacterized protein (DUF608 family)
VINRRSFLKDSSAVALGLLFSRLPAMAGPFTREDFDHLVPADKKLSPDWVKSLFARGEPEVLRGSELKFAGMPVGGICTGQLYLGGDGRLWHWDIFNSLEKTEGKHYANPQLPSSPVAQGFAVRIKSGGKIQTRKLQQGEWADISFRGEYPIGRVEYADVASPVSATLEAFSPFIPLNPDDSSLPATILEITLKNTGVETVEAELRGWLENAVGLTSTKNFFGERVNQIVKAHGHLQLDCSAKELHPDEPAFANAADFGTMTFALLDADKMDSANAAISLDNIFEDGVGKPVASAPLNQQLIGALGRKLELKSGDSAKVTFVLAWHFPNLTLPKLGRVGRHYATRFASSSAVAEYIGKNFPRLESQTKMWRDTWYDSTLPFWFLDRTFLNASTLATSTCHRFASGRFYGWEGVGSCEGTCGHVYLYAQAIARLFPELERTTREEVDFGLAQMPDGAIHFRGELNKIPAVDAQSGYVLRALREHQMSSDDKFLRRNWPKIKLAMQWLIAKDANNDGFIESNQHNTLDTDWYGKVAWLSGLYLAALAAAAEMAGEVDDTDFAIQCRDIFETGRENFVAQLFDGDYFINKVDPQHLDAINSGTGCEIDQVFGQSWAFQVGLPRVLPKKETVTALKSLWRYNFAPDVGPYRQINKPGRPFALPGEAGLLMCTFPRSDWDFVKASGTIKQKWAAGYFNECMNGFEHQVAGHMIWEGMALEGLAVERAVHDRYQASRRNPWNEIECGDHYARSMASYGVFLAACGFEHHGPKQHIGFAPKLSPENFKCAFTSAEGWGNFSQKIEAGELDAVIAVRWGKLQLKTLSLAIADNAGISTAKLTLGNKQISAKLKLTGNCALIMFDDEIHLTPEKELRLVLT